MWTKKGETSGEEQRRSSPAVPSGLFIGSPIGSVSQSHRQSLRGLYLGTGVCIWTANIGIHHYRVCMKHAKVHLALLGPVTRAIHALGIFKLSVSSSWWLVVY
jgi:hypothetical protein